MSILKCIFCLAVISLAGFAAGRVLSKVQFNTEIFPFRVCKIEKSGKLYEKLSIKKWQNKLPDMSRIFMRIMPEKRLTECTYVKLTVMINETCIAELTHIVLAFSGFLCIVICSGTFSVICSVMYFIGNIPFIMIQRYNRPRLVRLRKKIIQGGRNDYANTDTQLQYR